MSATEGLGGRRSATARTGVTASPPTLPYPYAKEKDERDDTTMTSPLLQSSSAGGCTTASPPRVPFLRLGRAAKAQRCTVNTPILLAVAVLSFCAGALYASNGRWQFVFLRPSPTLLPLDPRVVEADVDGGQSGRATLALGGGATGQGASGSTVAASVFVVLQGSITQRLQTLCAAEAYLSSRGVPVTAVWSPDDSVLQADFKDLFLLPLGSLTSVRPTWPSDVAVASLRNLAVKVRFGLRRNQASDSKDDATSAAGAESTEEEDSGSVVLQFLAPKELLPAGLLGEAGAGGTLKVDASGVPVLLDAQEVSEDDAMALLSSLSPDRHATYAPPGTVAQCMRRLRPSKAVQSRLLLEDLPLFTRSYGVFAERKKPGEVCPGCKGRLSVCTIRNIAKVFLRDPALDLVMASEDPRDAANVSATFHPTRAPGLSQASVARLRHGCQLMHQLASVARAASAAAAATSGSGEGGGGASGVLDHQLDLTLEGSGDSSYEESMTPLSPLCAQLYVADLLLLGLARGLMHTVVSSPAVAFILARLPMAPSSLHANLGVRVLLPHQVEHAGAGSQEQAAGSGGEQADAHGGEQADARTVTNGTGARLAPQEQEGVKQGRRSVLPLSFPSLSFPKHGAASGVSGSGAPVESREELRAVPPPMCVCTSPPVPQLADHVHAPNTIIDKELKIVYCSVEKVASTSLKMLIRAMRKLPGLTHYFRTHTRGMSGLRYLWPHFKGWSKRPALEFAGIREMTRRDYIKFVFVRNPYTRFLSAYLDKEVMGDSRNGKDNPKGRMEYNRKFFGRTFQQWYGRPGKGGVHVPWSMRLDFYDFTNITAYRAGVVAKMDHHLANQTDLCRLDSIKYDFVGHLETLDSDAQRLMEVLTQHTGKNASEHAWVFPRGQRVHHMKSDQRLLLYYKPKIVDMVTKMYQPDLRNELNNITYGIPEALQPMMSEATASTNSPTDLS